jgi:hypothetical protein
MQKRTANKNGKRRKMRAGASRAFFNANKNRYTLAPRTDFSDAESRRITFIDPHKFVTLKYVQSFQVSPLTATASHQVMRLNSPNDPDLTGGGHQPYGWDQLVPLYNRYRPWKTYWRVTFSPSSASYGAVVVPTNGALAAAIADQATFMAACEVPYAKSWMQGSSGQSKVITASIALNELNGTRKEEYANEERFSATTTATPTELLQLQIGVFNTSAGTIIINFLLEMLFEIELMDPIIQAQSSVSLLKWYDDDDEPAVPQVKTVVRTAYKVQDPRPPPKRV